MIGSTLGQYQIDRLLGRGGMAVVYLAFDTKLNRRLKLDPKTEGAVYVVGIGHPVHTRR